MAKVHTQKTIHDSGKTFIGRKKGNTITVKMLGTAPGQSITVATCDFTTKTWTDRGRKGALPTKVKEQFEEYFDN